MLNKRLLEINELKLKYDISEPLFEEIRAAIRFDFDKEEDFFSRVTKIFDPKLNLKISSEIHKDLE